MHNFYFAWTLVTVYPSCEQSEFKCLGSLWLILAGSFFPQLSDYTRSTCMYTVNGRLILLNTAVVLGACPAVKRRAEHEGGAQTITTSLKPVIVSGEIEFGTYRV